MFGEAKLSFLSILSDSFSVMISPIVVAIKYIFSTKSSLFTKWYFWVRVLIFFILFIFFKLNSKGEAFTTFWKFDGVLRRCPYIILVSWIEEKLLSWLKVTSVMTESLAGFMTPNQRRIRERAIVEAFLSVKATSAGSALAGVGAQCSGGRIPSDNHIF